jgi:hypothetical protein
MGKRKSPPRSRYPLAVTDAEAGAGGAYEPASPAWRVQTLGKYARERSLAWVATAAWPSTLNANATSAAAVVRLATIRIVLSRLDAGVLS